MNSPNKDDEMKWYFIAFGVIMVTIVGSQAYSDGKKNQAKRDVLVACYNSGTKDCDTKIGNAFTGD